MINILVVEDDKKLNQIVCTYLNDNGYTAKGCLNPREAYDLMYVNQYDLIISDIMMPEIDGFEFAETVRDVNKTIPILFMTAREDISSKRKGFRAGIDDYMVKPINMDELVLRVGALLRRANIASEKRLTVGNLVLDADEMTATVNGEEIPVTVREFNILYKMLSYPKHTFSRAQLMDEFWGIDSETSLRAVDVYITKLRDSFLAVRISKSLRYTGLGIRRCYLEEKANRKGYKGQVKAFLVEGIRTDLLCAAGTVCRTRNDLCRVYGHGYLRDAAGIYQWHAWILGDCYRHI